MQIDREIMQMEAKLSALREHYKDTYPDVRRVQAQLSSAKKMREKILAEEEETIRNRPPDAKAGPDVWNGRPGNSMPPSNGRRRSSKRKTWKQRAKHGDRECRKGHSYDSSSN